MTAAVAGPAAGAAPPAARAGALATWRRWLGPLALGLTLVGFFGALTYVNCFWSCFPNDNDLDEVGWLAAHLNLGRPESFANQGYPPGLPVVLRLLTPVVGSFLRATFLWQSIAATASMYFVTRIASRLCRHPLAGALAFTSAALAGLPLFTSEFADGSSTALFLGGLWALTRRGADRRGFFWLGIGSGLAYLFRTHYLILMALAPAALLLAGFGLRNAPKLVLAFWAGFAATAWPLWLLNTLAYGTPLHAGVSQYNIAYAVIPNALDWQNYANTYSRWPLSRILEERPYELLEHAYYQMYKTLSLDLCVVGAGLGGFAMVLVRDQTRRRLLAFGGLLALAYVFAVIVPTRYTDRAFAPVAMICSVLVGCGLAELLRLTARPFWYLPWAALFVGLINYQMGLWDLLEGRSRDARYNVRLSNLLAENGMRSSDEVFSNLWNVYNMNDPRFITFYNYGGWIELDSEYARQRPHPTAVTVPEWQGFFAAHGIRFAVLRKRVETAEIFKRPPDTWKKLFSDKSLTIWAIDPAPEAQKQVAAE